MFVKKEKIPRQYSGSPDDLIGTDIEKNIEEIKNTLGNSTDLVINLSYFGSDNHTILAVVYLSDLVDQGILASLSAELSRILKSNDEILKKNRIFSELKEYLGGCRKSVSGSDFNMLYEELLEGNVIYLLNHSQEFFAVEAASSIGRAVGEPTSQTIVRGPKDAFTENISNNILLIRKRIKNKDLRVENIQVNSFTRSKIALLYINNIAKMDTINEVKKRIGRIQIDTLLDSHYLEELIKDDKYSIFPTILNSEKPDSVVAGLLEGKVAIVLDGTPYVLTVPALFIDFLHSSEDYYHNFIASSLIRILRFMAFILALTVPAVYTALVSYHQEIIPTTLLINIAAQREDVPLPAFIEVLLMEVSFELLREAGIRMPKAVGSAISIVGALVLGQSAVEAGLVSAATVIVVSITAICSFVIPNYEMSNAIRAIRFVLLLLAGVLGLYGVIIGLTIMVFHLCKLKSITLPYMTPFAPYINKGNKDAILRFPLWSIPIRSMGNISKKEDVTDIYYEDTKDKQEFS